LAIKLVLDEDYNGFISGKKIKVNALADKMRDTFTGYITGYIYPVMYPLIMFRKFKQIYFKQKNGIIRRYITSIKITFYIV
jgi:hypothetical protein